MLIKWSNHLTITEFNPKYYYCVTTLYSQSEILIGGLLFEWSKQASGGWENSWTSYSSLEANFKNKIVFHDKKKKSYGTALTLAAVAVVVVLTAAGLMPKRDPLSSLSSSSSSNKRATLWGFFWLYEEGPNKRIDKNSWQTKSFCKAWWKWFYTSYIAQLLQWAGLSFYHDNILASVNTSTLLLEQTGHLHLRFQRGCLCEMFWHWGDWRGRWHWASSLQSWPLASLHYFESSSTGPVIQTFRKVMHHIECSSMEQWNVTLCILVPHHHWRGSWTWPCWVAV